MLVSAAAAYSSARPPAVYCGPDASIGVDALCVGRCRLIDIINVAMRAHYLCNCSENVLTIGSVKCRVSVVRCLGTIKHPHLMALIAASDEQISCAVKIFQM